MNVPNETTKNVMMAALKTIKNAEVVAASPNMNLFVA